MKAEVRKKETNKVAPSCLPEGEPTKKPSIWRRQFKMKPAVGILLGLIVVFGVLLPTFVP